MNIILIAVLTLVVIGIIVGTVIAISKSVKNKSLTPRKTILILIPIVVILVIIAVVLCMEYFSEPVF